MIRPKPTTGTRSPTLPQGFFYVLPSIDTAGHLTILGNLVVEHWINQLPVIHCGEAGGGATWAWFFLFGFPP